MCGSELTVHTPHGAIFLVWKLYDDFSFCCDQIPDDKSLKRRGFSWAHSLGMQSMMMS